MSALNRRPAPTNVGPEPDEDADLGPSKSQRKREMHTLQKLGERLVELPASRLGPMGLPEELLDAIALCRKITAHEGRRRQMQLIGKLMRRVDADAIRAELDVDDDRHRAETAVMHAAESWRDALIATPDRLTEFVQRYPQAITRGLHPLLRSACIEHSRAQRGRHYRELYREIRNILLAETRPPQTDTGHLE